MIGYCFPNAPSFSSLKAALNYTKTCSETVRQACYSLSSEISQTCTVTNSIFRGACSVVLIFQGIQVLRTEKWKLGLIGIAMGGIGFSMEAAQLVSCSKISQTFFSNLLPFCAHAPSPLEAKGVVKLNLAQKEVAVSCLPTVWDAKEGTFISLCKVKKGIGESPYEVRCTNYEGWHHQIIYAQA